LRESRKDSFGNILTKKSKEKEQKNRKFKDKINSMKRSALPATGQISL